MGNKKDIGDAIHEKLHSLDKMPSETVWKAIEEDLDKKKKRRIAIFFFWTKTVGVFLLTMLFGLYLYQTGNDKKPSVINTEKATEANQSTPSGQYKKQYQSTDAPIVTNESAKDKTDKNGTNTSSNSIENRNNAGSHNDFNSHSAIGNTNSLEDSRKIHKSKNTKSESKTGKTVGASQKTNTFKNKPLSFAKVKKKAKKTHIKKGLSTSEKNILGNKPVPLNADKNTNPSFDLSSLSGNNTSSKTKEIDPKKKDSLISKKNKEEEVTIFMYPKKDEDSAKIYRKFDVDVFVSPTSYGYFSNSSSLGSELDSLPKSSKIQLSYGFGVSYDLSERFSVRIGYSKIKLSITTKDASINTSNYSGISYNPNINNETIASASNGAEKMDITQKLSYTEIPLEVSYRFLDKKISMKAQFGFSYLMLNENNVVIKTNNGFSQDIGKTAYLMKTSISVNVGLGLDYTLFKNTKLFVEPMLNYQAKAFDRNNYKPYFIGIHTGIRYTFLNK